MMNNLTDIERVALRGLQEKQEQIQIDQRVIIRAIEDRLRLPTGSIGVTHQIDPTTWCVVKTAQEAT